MNGRTVREELRQEMFCPYPGADYDQADTALERLGIDPDTDLDTHVIVAVPMCQACQGGGGAWGPELTEYECPGCDGRGWVLP